MFSTRRLAPTLTAFHHADRLVAPTQYGVAALFLFGSVARGEGTASRAIDLLVEFEANETVGLFRFLQLQFFLEALLERPVDLTTPDALPPAMRAQIMQECVPVG